MVLLNNVFDDQKPFREKVSGLPKAFDIGNHFLTRQQQIPVLFVSSAAVETGGR
jgi:hypothetical protein